MVIFGLSSTTILISQDVTQSQFDAASYVIQILSGYDGKDITILASPIYSWIFADIFDIDNVPADYSIVLFEQIPTQDILLVADSHFIIDTNRGTQLLDVYNKTTKIEQFDGNVQNYDLSSFPFSSMKLNGEGERIEIKTNSENLISSNP